MYLNSTKMRLSLTAVLYKNDMIGCELLIPPINQGQYLLLKTSRV
jgi:hypothetical protein